MKRRALVVCASVIAAAVLAPTALAQRPDDRAGMLGVGGVAASTEEVLRPDDRGGVRGAGAVTFSSPPADVASTGGFDWADAGVGMAGGLVVALAAAGLLVAATHRRRLQTLA